MTGNGPAVTTEATWPEIIAEGDRTMLGTVVVEPAETWAVTVLETNPVAVAVTEQFPVPSPELIT